MHVWGKFGEILESVRDNRITYVQSANAVGKTVALSALTLWWLDTRDEATVFTSAARHSVLANSLWPRIHALNQDARVFAKEYMLDLAIKLGPKRFALAKSSDTAEGVQGVHSANVLATVDEASGIEPKLDEGINGNVSSDNDRIIYAFNPLEPSGVVYDKIASGQGNLIKISAFDHPNVIEGREIIPGAVSRAKVLTDCLTYGVEVEPHASGATHLPWCDRWFRLDHRGRPRILGEFPESSSEALISRSAITAVVDRAKGMDLEAYLQTIQ